MAGRAVVGGAEMWCRKGTVSCKLNATTDPFAKVDGKVLATIRDRDPVSNLLPGFGHCKAAGMTCVPSPVGVWQPGESGVKLASGVPVLDEQSFLICLTGPGVIEITDPGQSFFYVDTGSMNVELVYDGLDVVGYATEQDGIIRIYDTEGAEVYFTEEPVPPTDDLENLIDIIGVAGLGKQVFKRLGGKKVLGLLGIKSAGEIAEAHAREWASRVVAVLRRRQQERLRRKALRLKAKNGGRNRVELPDRRVDLDGRPHAGLETPHVRDIRPPHPPDSPGAGRHPGFERHPRPATRRDLRDVDKHLREGGN